MTKRRVLSWITWLGLLALLGLYVFSSLQDRFLYRPAKADLAGIAAEGLSAWHSDGDFRGLIAEPKAPARGTVVVFHGNAGHAGQRAYYARTLVPIGWRVILAEYPGYGPRDGSIGEAALVEDAQVTIVRAHKLFGSPVVLIGESLGAGVAAAVAGREKDKVAGLLLFTPWDRLERVASHHFPILGVRWLLRDRYDNAKNLAGFRHPIVVIVAELDGTVPAQFGRSLYQGLTDPKRLRTVDGADHNTWQGSIDKAWWIDNLGFLLGEEKAP